VTASLHRLSVLLLLAALLSAGGCGPRSDPLKGWKKWGAGGSYHLDKAIMEDFRAYVESLPSPEREIGKAADDYLFCEDGTGKHAIELDVSHDGKHWKHVVIYDTNNRRVKVIRYWSGRYSS
jgi:hypothetical protein